MTDHHNAPPEDRRPDPPRPALRAGGVRVRLRGPVAHAADARPPRRAGAGPGGGAPRQRAAAARGGARPGAGRVRADGADGVPCVGHQRDGRLRRDRLQPDRRGADEQDRARRPPRLRRRLRPRRGAGQLPDRTAAGSGGDLMKPAVFRLVLFAGLFALWMGYLGYLVLTRPRTPQGAPLVLSRPQIQSSDVDVIAEIDSEPKGETA